MNKYKNKLFCIITIVNVLFPTSLYIALFLKAQYWKEKKNIYFMEDPSLNWNLANSVPKWHFKMTALLYVRSLTHQDNDPIFRLYHVKEGRGLKAH